MAISGWIRDFAPSFRFLCRRDDQCVRAGQRRRILWRRNVARALNISGNEEVQ
jgi:hypothetical protein